jgi:predicted metal-dependent hydrolase
MPKPKLRQLELPLEFNRDEAVPQAYILIDGRLVGYGVKRSRRRRGSYTLTIDERGLRIGIPWHATQRAIENELHKHEAWIMRNLVRWERRRAPPLRWEEGEVLMRLGRPLRLGFEPALTATASDGERLLVAMPPSSPAQDIARTVTAWLRDQALACFAARIAHYAPQLRVPVPEIRLSEARTRWGSCHPGGRVRLNWRLIQMPLRLVDYVVVHELAHLREMNHSARFWRTVAGIIPDYAACRAEIRVEGYRYLLT